MDYFWNKLQPKDRYVVSCNGLLHDYDRKVLTLLYQPLIGLEPFGLYMSLWCQVEENRLVSSTASTHKDLMGLLGTNLRKIFFWRQKLEGMGLLKSYVKETDAARLIIYELQPPLSPDQFFNKFNIYLFRHLGEQQYIRIKRFFSDRPLQKSDFVEETMSFEDVFTSLSEEALNASKEAEEQIDFGDSTVIGRGEPTEILANAESFIDIDFIIKSSTMVPKDSFTPEVRKTIGILAFVYDIDAVKMKNMVLDAFEPSTDTINIKELRKIAKNWYEVEHKNKLPKLVDKIQPPLWHSLNEAPKNEEEEHIYYLESTSPRMLLTKLAGGAEPAAADLKKIEEIMFKQKLEPGVINVLIELAMIKNDMKLSKDYLETIASHWARKKIKTAKGAIEYAREKDQEYKEWAENDKKKKTTRYKKATRTEVIPDWFNKRSEGTTEVEKDEFDLEFEEEKRKLEEELRQFRKER